jgi:hypothetical protein
MPQRKSELAVKISSLKKSDHHAQKNGESKHSQTAEEEA